MYLCQNNSIHKIFSKAALEKYYMHSTEDYNKNGAWTWFTLTCMGHCIDEIECTLSGAKPVYK